MKRLGSLVLLTILFFSSTSFYYRNYSQGAYYIIIDKSDYELTVYDASGWLVAYPVVFGNKNQGDKMYEGDRKTPEGTFTIISKRVHEKWDRFLMLDYPTVDSYTKFNDRKSKGLIPTNAKIGGGVGIHGTWPHEDYAVDNYDNWTQGCISMKNEHVEQIYRAMPVGTKVTIRP